MTRNLIPVVNRTNIQVEGINLACQRKTSELRKNGHKPQRCCICPCHASHLMKGNEKLWRGAVGVRSLVGVLRRKQGPGSACLDLNPGLLLSSCEDLQT